jgi:hypothetical protein
VSSWAHSRTWATLPGRGLELLGIDGLDGVDHRHLGLLRLEGAEDGFQADFREQGDVGVQAQAVAAQGDLGGGFLAADVQGPGAGADLRQGLQQQGGLADARVAPQQHHAAAHQAAAQHPVELGQAGGQARRLDRLHGGQPHHLAAGGQGLETPGLGLLDRFGQGVPGQAVGTLALPFAGLAAALGADVEGGRFGHGGIRAYSGGGNKKARRTGLFG